MSHSLEALNEALDGRYRVQRELGQGGMATVYLAHDVRNHRDVALKVLRPELAAIVGGDRFLAEIKTTANLRHPHILPLFDSGQVEGLVYYAMPYVDGESLRDRLTREGALPIEEAVRLAQEVAEGLDYAHRQGVVHRDIKPANILLLDGKAVVSDFGIALAVGMAGGDRLTETGLSLGTPHYMSPEQATGDQPLSPRSDVYSLGCVLYEMLVGDPPFGGTTFQNVLGKLITGRYDPVHLLRATVPPHVEAATDRALELLPADRFQSAGDFVAALRNPDFRHRETPEALQQAAAARRWKPLATALATLSLLLVAVLTWEWTRPSPEGPVMRFQIPFDPTAQPSGGGSRSYALTPDGSGVIYQSGDPDNRMLWIRDWGSLDARPIPGTEGAGDFSVSSNGRDVVVSRDEDIIVVPVDGGPTRLVDGNGFPVLGRDGYLYQSAGTIIRAPLEGGTTETVWVGGEDRMFVSDVIPEEEVLLAWTPQGSELRALRIGDSEVKTLITSAYGARYLPEGFLIYVDLTGTLTSARFDPGSMEIIGRPLALVGGVSGFSVSDSGSLFYSTQSTRRVEFVWISRSGETAPFDEGWTIDPGPDSPGWDLSPDGTRLAVHQTSEGSESIWINEGARGTRTRLTRGSAPDRAPRWAPDGQSITFASQRGAGFDLWSVSADGSGVPALLYDHEGVVAEGSWIPGSERLVLRASPRDILTVDPSAESDAEPVAATSADETQPAVSPDGRWLAYVSDETGAEEVFVRPLTGTAQGALQLSFEGGVMPLWSPNGRELFFVSRDRTMMAALWSDEGRVQGVQRLFQLTPNVVVSDVTRLMSVDADNQRFLFGRYSEGGGEGEFVLVLNFIDEILRLFPS